MNASTKKRHVKTATSAATEGWRKVDVRAVNIPSPEFAQMWPACLNKCERDDEDTCREIRKSVAKYSSSVTPRGRVEEKRLWRSRKDFCLLPDRNDSQQHIVIQLYV